jgi:hypothetical protein
VCVEWSGGGAVEVVAALHASCPRACSLKKKRGARPAPGIHATSATAAHLASAELGVARMAWGQKAAGGSGARVAWGEVMKASENDAKQRGRELPREMLRSHVSTGGKKGRCRAECGAAETATANVDVVLLLSSGIR